jgi:hypothetical protein
MKKIFKKVLTPAILIWVAGFLVLSVVIALDIRKDIRFQKCINEFPSDAVCDSCYQKIYHNEKIKL